MFPMRNQTTAGPPPRSRCTAKSSSFVTMTAPSAIGVVANKAVRCRREITVGNVFRLVAQGFDSPCQGGRELGIDEKTESPDIKVGRSSANRHNLRGVSSPSVIE